MAALLLSLGGAALGCEAGPDAAAGGGGQSASRRTSLLTPSAHSEAPEEVVNQANPVALRELLHTVPSAQPSSTDANGGTLVGTDTKQPGSVTPIIAVAPTHPPELTAGTPIIEPLLSSPAIEQAARAQIYWALHKACPGPAGNALPPEVITLVFTIRADGTVEPASVQAAANDARYNATAECVLRTFSSLPFHGPPAGRGSTTPVVVTWPSVD